MTEPRTHPGSFRDPSGFVFEREGNLYRQVDGSFAESFERLGTSGLYEALTTEGLLIPHREVSIDLAAAPGAHRVIQPERVDFVSYPYEWCFGQLKDAALATLRAQRLAMERGMTLRDASAYNLQFHRGRPVLIDSLSFEPIREGAPWRAYAQFCQHFLAPLALMAGRDVRLGRLLRSHIDGVPLDLAAKLLPARTKARPSVWLHLVAHGRAQVRHAGEGTARRGEQGPAASPRRFSLRAFRGLVDSLERAIRGLRWDPPPGVWTGYYRGCASYSPEALRHKEEAVARLVEDLAPGTVWDLGANTGRFSRLAAAGGAFTVALDGDPAAVEASYRDASDRPNLLPLVMDLADPSPPVGWGNEERLSLAERGPADLLLALALIHHLTIGGEVPLPRVADQLATLGKAAIVEWVPRDDPQVRDMLARRDHPFERYSLEEFERAFGERFDIGERVELPGSGRTLYLLRRP